MVGIRKDYPVLQKSQCGFVWRLSLEEWGFVNSRRRGRFCVLGGKNTMLKVIGFVMMIEEELQQVEEIINKALSSKLCLSITVMCSDKTAQNS